MHCSAPKVGPRKSYKRKKAKRGLKGKGYSFHREKSKKGGGSGGGRKGDLRLLIVEVRQKGGSICINFQEWQWGEREGGREESTVYASQIH